MINKRMRISGLIILTLSTLSMLSAVDPISFKGGYTKAVMIEGKEAISLTQGALIQSGPITLSAQTIELIGPNARFLTGTDKVTIKDSEKNIIIKSNRISFDREQNTLLVDGWVEIEDLDNELIASGAFLNYDSATGNMTLQVSASIHRNTDDGIMILKGNSIEYNREKEMVSIIGDAFTSYNGDTYSSSITIVNLSTNEITMSGEISGSINE